MGVVISGLLSIRAEGCSLMQQWLLRASPRKNECLPFEDTKRSGSMTVILGGDEMLTDEENIFCQDRPRPAEEAGRAFACL